MLKFDTLKSATIVFKDGLEVEVEDTTSNKSATSAINAFEEGRMMTIPTADECIIKAYPNSVRYVKVCTNVSSDEYEDDICNNI